MKFKNYLDKKFKITEKGSTIKTELGAGFINFLVTCYVMIVIPSILIKNNPQVVFSALFIGTVISIVVCTFAIGVFANTPLVYAPGIGIASYTASLIASGTYTYDQVLVIVLVSAIVFVLLTVFKLRDKLVNAIPDFIKDCMPIGIGLFIATLGLGDNSGILTFLSQGPLAETASGLPVWTSALVCLVSLTVIMCFHLKNIKGSIFYGIIAGTIVNIVVLLCMGQNPLSPLTSGNWIPNFGEFFSSGVFKYDFAGVFTAKSNLISSILNFVIVVYAFTLVDIFDTVGTVIGISKRANLYDENGKIQNMNRIMYVDSLSGVFGSMIGVPTCTAYIESTAGIESGGRTGLSSVFTSLLFLICLFLSPLVMIIPTAATSGALIFVGILMVSGIKDLKFENYYTIIPAFFTILLMPLTSNISYGIAGGMISYSTIMLFTGKGKQVNALTYVCSILFAIFFVTQGIF